MGSAARQAPEGRHHDRRAGRPSRPRPGRCASFALGARPAVGGPHHLFPHLGGLSLPRDRRRLLLAPLRRLGDARRPRGRARRRGARDGRLEAQAEDRGSWTTLTRARHTSRLPSRSAVAVPRRAVEARRAARSTTRSARGALKKELVHRRSWPTRRETQTASSSGSSRSTTAKEGTPRSGSSLPRRSRRSPSPPGEGGGMSQAVRCLPKRGRSRLLGGTA